KLKLRGHASDDGCTATISVAGEVARVEVAISRKAGKKCRFVASSGKLGSPRKCSKPVFLKAKGTTTWSLSLKRKLPHAKYTILLRARDAAGNLQATAAKRTVRLETSRMPETASAIATTIWSAARNCAASALVSRRRARAATSAGRRAIAAAARPQAAVSAAAE